MVSNFFSFRFSDVCLHGGDAGNCIFLLLVLYSYTFFDIFFSAVWCYSRGEVEGADSDGQGAPWETRPGV